MFGLGTRFPTQRPAQVQRGPVAKVDMTWRLVRMSVNEIAAGTHLQLQVAFDAMFRSSKAPTDAAMFANRHIEDDYTYYFAPGASRFFSGVMTGFGAKGCPAPDRESVSLLVGNADAVASLLRPVPETKGG